MLGTVVNSVAIIIGGIIGLFLKKGIKDEYKDTIMNGIGLCIIIIGIMGAIESQNIILVVASIVLGSILGETIDIEKRLNTLGDNLEKRFSKDGSNFSKGFVTASLVFCIGAMAIQGSIQSGLTGDHSILLIKTVLDGTLSVMFASTLGIGVAFSSIAVFLYQGSITLLANGIKGFMTPDIINEMSAVGGVLIMAIGINILEIKKIRIGNMLPAIFIPIVYYLVINIFT